MVHVETLLPTSADDGVIIDDRGSHRGARRAAGPLLGPRGAKYLLLAKILP